MTVTSMAAITSHRPSSIANPFVIAAAKDNPVITAAKPARVRDLDGYWCGWHAEGGYSGVALLVIRKTSIVTSNEFDLLFSPKNMSGARRASPQVRKRVTTTTNIPPLVVVIDTTVTATQRCCQIATSNVVILQPPCKTGARFPLRPSCCER